MNIARDCAIKVQVAREIASVRWREPGIDIEAVPGKIIIFLGNVDLLRVRWKNCAPQTCSDKRTYKR